MTGRSVIGAAALLLGLGLLGCSGSPAGVQSDHPLTGAAPEGVDGAVWHELSDELARQLAHKGTSAAADITDDRFRVTDFELVNVEPATANETEVLTFSWTYRNPADYNLDGEVNATDLVIIAKYLYMKDTAPEWDLARLADGNGDGEVNQADIAPLAANFGNSVNGMFLSIELLDYDQNSEMNAADIAPMFIMLMAHTGYFPRPSTEWVWGGGFGPHGDRFGTAGRISSEEEPGPFLAAMPITSLWPGRSLENGEVRFTGQLRTRDSVESIFYGVVPFRVNAVERRTDLGQLSDTIQHFVTPYTEPEE